jgi:methionine-rich copper-binding protein CopC
MTTAHTPFRRARVRSVALVAGLVLTAGLTLVAAPAQAHDELISSNPADKAQVAALPDQVVLTFEEPPVKTGSQVLIKGPSGNVQTGDPQFTGDDVTQAVAPGSPAGTYTVTWRVTSDDGHAVFGTFSFTAAAGNAAATSTATSTPSSATGTPASSDKPSANKALWFLVLLVLLVPVALFVRRGAARSRELSQR